MAQDWDIRPRSDVCTHCSQTFQDGQSYVSALVPGPEGYQRVDYHEACWSDLSGRPGPQAPAVAAAGGDNPQADLFPQAGNSGAAFSVWRSIFRLPPPPEEEALKKETAESLLRKLMESDDAANRNIIYILAVMLERKRLLVERAVERRDDNTTLRVYEHRKTRETFVIPEPNLQLNQLETVQAEVIAMLDGHKAQA
jgi:hypothetical protein